MQRIAEGRDGGLRVVGGFQSGERDSLCTGRQFGGGGWWGIERLALRAELGLDSRSGAGMTEVGGGYGGVGGGCGGEVECSDGAVRGEIPAASAGMTEARAGYDEQVAGTTGVGAGAGAGGWMLLVTEART